MKSFDDLKLFNNVHLYIKDNFNDLNKLFFDIIIRNEINKNKNINNNEKVKRTKMYYFNYFPFETRY